MSIYIKQFELFLCTSKFHKHINKDRWSLPPATKAFVIYLFKMNISDSNQIQAFIRKESLPPISKRQIYSLLQSLKNKYK